MFAIKGEPGHFIKARCKVNVFEPLRSQVYASNEQIGEFWVSLIYKFLPLFCYNCGRLGHKAPQFKFLDLVGVEYYGPELSTNITGHRLDEQSKIPVHLLPTIPKSVWVNPGIKGIATGIAMEGSKSGDGAGGSSMQRAQGATGAVAAQIAWLEQGV
ncbi:unnamed protein product [Linum trigynum]|uniref:CCHC-type domain-containing protein n=1 Tax=Linum trigynum TaxID=586398 RepID=A0AAV2DCK8_9ROSI